jgi:hypothetical protein
MITGPPSIIQLALKRHKSCALNVARVQRHVIDKCNTLGRAEANGTEVNASFWLSATKP